MTTNHHRRSDTQRIFTSLVLIALLFNLLSHFLNVRIFSKSLKAASPIASVQSWGGVLTDSAQAVVVSPDGSTYVTGNFSDAVDFDPGSNIDTHSSVGGTDVFITKYNADKSYAWTRTFGSTANSDYVFSITTDPSNNVYISGRFDTAIDFDATTGSDLITPTAASAFITKYNADGSYGWTKTVANVSNSTDSLNRVKSDSQGNIYLAGDLYDTACFNGSTDCKTVTSGQAVFLTRYNNDGSYGWTRVIQSSSFSNSAYLRGLSLDSTDSLYLSGNFNGSTTDFNDTTSGNDIPTNLGSYDAYVTKYNADGSYGWTKTFGGTDSESAENISLDTTGNIYISGYFSGTADFDPSATTNNVTSVATTDLFVAKWDSTTSFQWVKNFGSSYYISMGAIQASSDGVYMAVNYSESVDIDQSGPLAAFVSLAYNYDTLFAKYSSDGTLTWGVSFGGELNDQILSLAVSNNQLLVAGYHTRYVDFDPSSGELIKPGFGGADAFLARYDLSNITSTLSGSRIISLPAAQTSFPTTPNTSNLIPDGTVNKVVYHNGFLYFGGTFTTIGPPTGRGVQVDLATGTPDSNYPNINSTVKTAVSDGATGWYIGGSFNQIAGIGVSGLAHILSDGSVDSSFKPTISGGTVDAMYLKGTELYVGGSFTQINGATHNRFAVVNTDGSVNSTDFAMVGSGVLDIDAYGNTVYVVGYITSVLGVARTRGFAIDSSTKALTSWAPTLTNVVSVAVSPDGSAVYVGRSATSSTLAKLSPTTGAAFSWTISTNGAVKDIAVSSNSSTLYITGDFTSVGGQYRRGVASVNAIAATVTTWVPATNGYNGVGNKIVLSNDNSIVYVGGDSLYIDAGQYKRRFIAMYTANSNYIYTEPNPNNPVYAIALNSNKLFIGGSFFSYGGVIRNRLAAIDLSSNTLTSWNPGVGYSYNFCSFGTICMGNDWGVDTLAVSPDGQTIYVGGKFSSVASATRNFLAAVNANGNLTDWNPNPDGRVYDFAIKDDLIYLAGYFSNIGTTARSGAAAIHMSDGTLTGFNPGIDSYGTTSLDISPDGNYVYYGGEFELVGTVSQAKLARFDATAGALDTSWAPVLNNWVDTLAHDNTTLYVGGVFTSINGQTRYHGAAFNLATGNLTPWDPGISPEYVSYGPKDFLITDTEIFVAGDFSTTAYDYSRRGLSVHDKTTGALLSWSADDDLPLYNKSLATDGTTLWVGGLYNTSPRISLLAFTGTGSVVPTSTPTSAPTSTLSVTSTPTPTSTSSGDVLGVATTDPYENITPVGAPDLFQITTTTNTATLFFAPAPAPNSYYYVSYGTTPSANDYAARYNQADSPGVLQYTIKSLKPNTRYYFKVRGGNKNTSGPFSRTLNAVTNGDVYLPGVSPKPTSKPKTTPTAAVPTAVPTFAHRPPRPTTTPISCPIQYNSRPLAYYLPSQKKNLPKVNGKINSLVSNQVDTYLAGSFTKAGKTNTSLAKLDKQGKVTSQSLNVDGSVFAMALDNTNNKLYLGGNYSKINGKKQQNLTVLDTKTLQISAFSVSTSQPVLDMAVSKNGKKLFLLTAKSSAACGPTTTPVPVLTNTPTSTPTSSLKPSPTSKNKPKAKASATPNLTLTPTLKPTSTTTLTPTLKPSSTATPQPSPTSTLKPSPSSTLAPSPTMPVIASESTPTPTPVDQSTTGSDTTSDTGTLIVVDTETGTSEIIPVANGPINAIATSADGENLIIGGDFDQVLGATRPNVAAINIEQTKVTSWMPRVDGVVTSLEVDARTSQVYAAGDFVSTDGKTKFQYAIIDPVSGKFTPWKIVDPYWLWQLLIQLLLTIIYYVLASKHRDRPYWWIIPLLFGLSSYAANWIILQHYIPSTFSLMVGQINLAILLATSIIYRVYRRLSPA